MKQTTSCPNSKPSLEEGQVKNLAVTVVKLVKAFYDNPKNEEAFQKWQTSVAKP